MISKEDTILVFGGSGKVGKSFMHLLKEGGYSYLCPRHCEVDMTNENALWKYINNVRPEYIVHLAGVTTTIALNKTNPAIIHHDTIAMTSNLLKACANLNGHRPKKIINILSSCSYGEADILKEEDYLKGNIHPSVMPHGQAKQTCYLMGTFYKQQFNMPVTHVCFNNICGSETWNRPETLKVLSALVKKVVDARNAGLPSIEVWGTGAARREFIHVQDAAEGLLRVLDKYNGDLINIGNGEDLRIDHLINELRIVANYHGEITFLTDRPDGQILKRLNITRQLQHLQWEPDIGWVELYRKLISEYEQYLKDNQ